MSYVENKLTILLANSLEMLEQCTWNDNDLPSWVPDWTNKNHYRLFSGRKSNYHASGASTPFIKFKNNDRILTVKGVTLDIISGVGQAYFEKDIKGSGNLALFQTENSANAYGSEQALRDALWRTLTGDCTPQGRPAPDIYASLLDCPLKEHYPQALPWRGARTFGRFLTQSAPLFIAGKRLESYFTSTAESFPAEATDALERLWRFSRTRRLIITREGRLGLAPHEAQRGDVVCVFLGCDVPILVRPGSGNDAHTFRMVGTCYLQGVMKGEIMEWIEKGDMEVKSILIT